jgi:branched-chain amino acid transport system ATP-binding protein
MIMSTILKVTNLTISYLTGIAVKDVFLQIDKGSIVTIIGSNGAGKSTILKAISGQLAPVKGEIIYNETRINGRRPFEIVKRGIVQVPEGGRIFAKLTVTENLKTGAFLRKDKKKVAADLKRVFSDFPSLRERSNQKAGKLSGGERTMLAFGRALMAKPTLLLLDEPSLGLSPIFVNKVLEIIKYLRKQGITILLVEQNSKKALQLADKAYVIESGRMVMEGPAEELIHSSEVKARYLGG